MASKTVTRSIQLGPRSHFHRLHSPSLSTEFVTISLSSTSQRRLIIGPFIRKTTENNFQFNLDRTCQDYSRRTLGHLSQELCPKSYRRSSAIFCEMGNTLSLQRNKKFLLTFKRHIRERRVQHTLMRNLRLTRRRVTHVITGTSLHKALCHALDHPRRFLVTWSGNDPRNDPRKDETKRNDWSVTN